MISNTKLKIFNTLGKNLEVFEPLNSETITFYHCGPTVYWVQHIGNLRAMVEADFMRRTLSAFGYNVNFVRNYTDVGHLTGDNIGDADSGEDRMAKGAAREHTTPEAIANKYIAVFDHDLEELAVLPPTHSPRATEYVTQMQQMVQELLDKGFAYTTPKAVYYDVSKFPNYTALSGQKLDENITGSGKGDIQDPAKKKSVDFALWFFKTGAHQNALQTWKSPFSSPEVEDGEGFPGWHIECSAMSKTLLGETIDLHMGGVEHIPVHHTNEIAQSEAANGRHFVDYWIHNEHLLVDDKKMSKSEGTSFTLQDVVSKGFEALALRYFFLNAHYRSKQNFTWEGMTAAQKSLDGLRASSRKVMEAAEAKSGEVISSFYQKFLDALANDFNLTAALATVFELLANYQNSEFSAADYYATLVKMDEVLGVDLFKAPAQKAALSTEQTSAIEALIALRNTAKAEKNFAEADRIRDEVSSKFAVKLVDSAAGTSWE